jgi:hypothetical protein
MPFSFRGSLLSITINFGQETIVQQARPAHNHIPVVVKKGDEEEKRSAGLRPQLVIF